MRIVVIEPDDEAQRDFAGLQMIDERAAVSRRRQRPADRVEDFARARVFVFDFPQFFDSDAVGLRRRFAAQIEFAHQVFRQRAAAALGEDGVFGAQFDSALKIRPARAVFFDSDIAGGDARDGALVVEQNLGGGEARKNLDSVRLGAGGEPSDDAPQTDDKIAFVFHRRRGRAISTRAWRLKTKICLRRRRFGAAIRNRAKRAKVRRARAFRIPRRRGYGRRERRIFRRRKRRFRARLRRRFGATEARKKAPPARRRRRRHRIPNFRGRSF